MGEGVGVHGRGICTWERGVGVSGRGVGVSGDGVGEGDSLGSPSSCACILPLIGQELLFDFIKSCCYCCTCFISVVQESHAFASYHNALAGCMPQYLHNLARFTRLTCHPSCLSPILHVTHLTCHPSC